MGTYPQISIRSCIAASGLLPIPKRSAYRSIKKLDNEDSVESALKGRKDYICACVVCQISNNPTVYTTHPPRCLLRKPL